MLQGLLARIAICLGLYLPPAERAIAAPPTVGALWDLARQAEAGSDKQLQLMRAVAGRQIGRASCRERV